MIVTKRGDVGAGGLLGFNTALFLRHLLLRGEVSDIVDIFMKRKQKI